MKHPKKAPKLRFKPGWFVRKKQTNQLYCIMSAFRLKETPNIWCFDLEERKDLSRPDTMLSILCEEMSGTDNRSRVLYEPINSSTEMIWKFNDYKHGDHEMVNTSTMLNEFYVVSYGEVD